MSFYDGLLFLHVASGFALVSALVTFWVVAIAGRGNDRPGEALRYFRVARQANVLVALGTIGTLVFGVWLAIYMDEYELWDGWILAALVLWAIAFYTGFRSGKPYAEAQKLSERLSDEGRADEPNPELRALLQSRPAMWLTVVSTVAVLALLVDMIYKPGA